ncbi:MAG: toprim domain-containing protein, partial [candidate division WOR-3 bacterium]
MRKPRPTKARALSKGRRTRTKARDTAPKSRVGSKQPGSGKTPATGGAKGTKEAGKLKGRAGRPLLIVESPTKARTIGNLLGARFTVLSSKGHIVDLPKTRLGVDLEHDFEPSYIQIPGKREIVRTLRQEASRSQEVLIGTDPDREGEAIAYFIAQAIDGNTARRVRFHEITQEGVRQALARPVEIDLRMVDAQKARRVLDRLVGYLTSPLLWRVMENHNLSAG